MLRGTHGGIVDFSRLVTGKIRRFLLVNFRKSQVTRNHARRHGECLQCANCCRLVFRCPWLTADNLCMVYKSRVRPQACAQFPIDERDLNDVRLASQFVCGYRFSPQETRTDR